MVLACRLFCSTTRLGLQPLKRLRRPGPACLFHFGRSITRFTWKCLPFRSFLSSSLLRSLLPFHHRKNSTVSLGLRCLSCSYLAAVCTGLHVTIGVRGPLASWSGPSMAKMNAWFLHGFFSTSRCCLGCPAAVYYVQYGNEWGGGLVLLCTFAVLVLDYVAVGLFCVSGCPPSAVTTFLPSYWHSAESGFFSSS